MHYYRLHRNFHQQIHDLDLLDQLQMMSVNLLDLYLFYLLPLLLPMTVILIDHHTQLYR